MHAPLLTRVCQPEFAAQAICLWCAIPTIGKFGRIQRKAQLDHLRRKIAAIVQRTSRDTAAMVVLGDDVCTYLLSFAQLEQGPFGSLAVRVVKLRNVNAKQSDLTFRYPKAISINNISRPDEDFTGLHRGRHLDWSGVWRD